MMWGYDYSWPGMLVMALNSIFWIALLAIVVWFLVRWLEKRGETRFMSSSTLSATELLRQRYARGEIDAATYEQMMARLEEHVPTEFMH